MLAGNCCDDQVYCLDICTGKLAEVYFFIDEETLKVILKTGKLKWSFRGRGVFEIFIEVNSCELLVMIFLFDEKLRRFEC